MICYCSFEFIDMFQFCWPFYYYRSLYWTYSINKNGGYTEKKKPVTYKPNKLIITNLLRIFNTVIGQP